MTGESRCRPALPVCKNVEKQLITLADYKMPGTLSSNEKGNRSNYGNLGYL